MIHNLSSNRQDPNAAEPRPDGPDSPEDEERPTDARTSKLVILNEKINAKEIEEKVAKVKAASLLESALFVHESKREGFAMDHDYAARPNVNKTNKKSKSAPRSRGSNQTQRRRQREESEVEEEDEEDDDEEEDEEVSNRVTFNIENHKITTVTDSPGSSI